MEKSGPIFKGYEIMENGNKVYRVYCDVCNALLLERYESGGGYQFFVYDCDHYKWDWYGNASPKILHKLGKLIEESYDYETDGINYYFLKRRKRS